MANLIVENRVCESCGTDVRIGSLFCYNCGESVKPKPEPQTIDERENVVQPRFQEDVDKNGNDLTTTTHEEVKILTHSEVLESVKAENISEKPVEEVKIKNTGIHEQAKLKSAASLRRKSKIIPKKKVEVVWEEHENAPNGWFIIVALLLAGLAVGVVYLAMHLR